MPSFEFVGQDFDPFAPRLARMPAGFDPFTPQDQDQTLASSMTHYPPDPAAEEVGRRVRQTGQNLYETWLGPAERLGRAATSGTLDVADPETELDALKFVAGTVAAGATFAEQGRCSRATRI